MSSATFRLILFISCAHALVHIYEISFSSVEQLIAADFHVATDVTGRLGTVFRLPFGLFAIAAGWMADHWGARRMLITFLLGCSATVLLIAATTNLSVLFLLMFVFGTLASIYHPAGLAMISHVTTPANRPRALGIHGILGSLGIGGGPLLAGWILGRGATWQQYYAILALPGLLLAVWFLFRLREPRPPQPERPLDPHKVHPEDEANWPSFFVLTVFGALMGFIYAAFITFLPRYVDAANLQFASVARVSVRNFLSSGVLLLGILGQYTAGRFARPARLEPQLALVAFSSAPLLAWMALAQGEGRVYAAASFALVHFMNQPIFNSLIARYSPRRRRSLSYGFSFLMAFGVGSFGAAFAGAASSDRVTYGTLAGLAVLAGVLVCVLWRRAGPSR